MIKNAKVTYPSYLSKEAVDLLQKLLQRKPSERLSCHDALRHLFFKKNGLNIEEEEETELKNLREQSIRNLNQTITSAERKPQPKVLSESDLFVPSLSEVHTSSEKKLKNNENQVEGKSEDSLEMSQSVFMTSSQLISVFEKVTCNLRET